MSPGTRIVIAFGQDPSNSHLSGPRAIAPEAEFERLREWAAQRGHKVQRAVKRGGSDWQITEDKTKKGPHGGGNEFDTLKLKDTTGKDLSKKTPQEKKKPVDSKENEIDPGDGAKLGNKAPASVAGLKKVGKDLKKKNSPGKATKNEALDIALDMVLNEIGPGRVTMKAPDILGVLGAPSVDALDAAEQAAEGDPCPGCDEVPPEELPPEELPPEELPQEEMPKAELHDADPSWSIRRRLKALGRFDDWVRNNDGMPPTAMGRRQ